MPLDPPDGADPITNGRPTGSVHEPPAEQSTVPPDAAGPADAVPPTTPEAGDGQAADYGAGAPSIPGYEVLGELGRGGMGVVYKARHLRLNRLVALKVILSGGHAGEAELARFRTEAEAVARLQHPNVVQVFDVGEHDGRPYLALEYVAGGSLAAKVGDAPLPPAEAAALVRLLAGAVQAAHDAKVVHRDLKPANVLLAEDGTPKVTDFGLAKKLDDAGQTATGAVMGTPSYMAPEQAGGKAKAVGPAADVWALGAVLYKLLTGRPPFQAATMMDTLVQVLADDPVPLRRLNPQVPRDLETVCLKCLEKDPGRRYDAAAALAEDLRRFGAGEPVHARPAGPLTRAGKWVRRRPVVAGLLALVVLVSVGGVGGILWSYGHTVHERDRALSAEAAARTAEALARSAEDAARAESVRANEQERQARAEKDRTRQMLYQSQIRKADAQLAALDVRAARESLDAAPREYRGWEFRYLSRRAEGTPLALIGHTDSVRAMVFSPDGARLATASGDGTARIWDVRSGAVLAVRHHPDHSGPKAFSPDGARLATTDPGGAVRLWDARTGSEALALRGHVGEVRAVAFSPDGSRLASAGDDKTARLWDARTGAEALALRGHTGPLAAVAFSPDSGRLATASFDGTVRVWDARTGAEGLTLRGITVNPGASLAFSPDGARLASGELTGAVRLWDARSGARALALRGHTGGVTAVAFSPDGSRLASASFDGTVRLWDARTGSEVFALLNHTDLWAAVAFSPDGARLATTDPGGAVRLWDARTGSEALALRGRVGEVRAVAFSPDGSRLATASGDGAARVWDARTGAEILAFRDRCDPLQGAVAFSPDGARLATTWRDGRVRVWDARTGAEILTFRSRAGRVYAVAFSPDGARLATASGGKNTVQLWDSRTGTEALSLPDRAGSGFLPYSMGTTMAFSPDGGRLATASFEGTVRVWDARTGSEALTLRGHINGEAALAFSPDGSCLSSAPFYGLVHLWDARTGAEVLALRGHTSGVTAVAFSPDGSRLATASSDKTVRLWDARTGSEALTLRGHTGAVNAVAFSPDGSRLASGSADGTVRLWEAPREGYDPWTDDEYRRHALAVARHAEDAELAARRGDGFALAFHLARLDALPITTNADRARRGLCRVRLGRRAEGLADLARHEQAGSENIAWLRWHSLACSLVGDRAAYRTACDRMLSIVGPNPESGPANDAAWNCCLGPGATADATAVVRLAEKALGSDPRNGAALSTLGAALLRAGRPADAVGRLEASLHLLAGREAARNELLLALAHHQLGHAEEARRWLKAGAAKMDRFRVAAAACGAVAAGTVGALPTAAAVLADRPDPRVGEGDDTLRQLLEEELLRAEAEAALAGPGS